MTYDEALAALKSALKFGIEPSLDGISALLERMGRPQDRFVSLQVAGTNGKTSTSRLLAAILQAQGMATGLYTSPELSRYPERIEVAGRVVSDEEFASAVAAALQAASEVERDITEFELLTAAAFRIFDLNAVDFAVLEVGMGGAWDSTSVVDPAVSVITGVGLDHQAILGDTLEEIAAEKAGIIKPASAPILGPGTRGLEQIFLQRAESFDTHARLVREVGEETLVDEALTIRYEVRSLPAHTPRRPGVPSPWEVDVHGAHADYPGLSMPAQRVQAINIATAVAAAEAALGRALDLPALRSAVAQCVVPGRFELLRTEPPVVIDGSHNPQAAAVLADTVRDAFPDALPTILLGVLGDKDARGIVTALAPVSSRIVVTAPVSPRALPAEELAAIVGEVTGSRPTVYETLPAALETLLSTTPSGLLIAGSITTAGQAKTYLGESLSAK